MTYPKPAIYRVKLESGLVTEDGMVPMGHCQVLLPLCPPQPETAVVGSLRGLPCEFIGTVTTGREPVVFSAALISHKFLIRAINARSRNPVRPSSAKRGLDDQWSSEEPLRTWLAPYFQMIWLMVAQVRPLPPAKTLPCMLSWTSASTSRLITIRVGRDIIGTFCENWKIYATVDWNLPHCEGRFWLNDHLNRKFGTHLALK